MSYMAYTTNPHLPRVRRDAVNLVRYRGWGIRKVARYIGVSPSTVSRWSHHPLGTGWHKIPTQSSRPHSHPKALSAEVVEAVFEYRRKYRRCAKVLHYLMGKDGYIVSLSSIERILRRNGLVSHSKWKKWHKYPPRPRAEKPGILVEIDTIVDGPHLDRLYIYTLLDVFSRWAYALPSLKMNTHNSLGFVKRAQLSSPFSFQTLQSDHGAEFSKWFTKRVNEKGLAHRHIHVRSPSENGHLERFNRTLQDECLSRFPRSLKLYRKEIPEYLEWYNNGRPHMGLEMKSPTEVLRSY